VTGLGFAALAAYEMKTKPSFNKKVGYAMYAIGAAFVVFAVINML